MPKGACASYLKLVSRNTLISKVFNIKAFQKTVLGPNPYSCTKGAMCSEEAVTDASSHEGMFVPFSVWRHCCCICIGKLDRIGLLNKQFLVLFRNEQ